MALSLLQKDSLTTNPTQIARTRQALREYAKYIKDIGASATQQQKDWSLQVIESKRAAQIAADIQGELVTDAKFASAVNADATDVTDANFKAAVEAICLKYV